MTGDRSITIMHTWVAQVWQHHLLQVLPALVREYYTEIENVASPSAALLKATLINGAADMTPGQYGEGDDQEITGRPDNSQGWGRVDVAGSLMADYPDVIAYYDSESLSTGETWTHTYDYIESKESFKSNSCYGLTTQLH